MYARNLFYGKDDGKRSWKKRSWYPRVFDFHAKRNKPLLELVWIQGHERRAMRDRLPSTPMDWSFMGRQTTIPTTNDHHIRMICIRYSDVPEAQSLENVHSPADRLAMPHNLERCLTVSKHSKHQFLVTGVAAPTNRMGNVEINCQVAIGQK